MIMHGRNIRTLRDRCSYWLEPLTLEETSRSYRHLNTCTLDVSAVYNTKYYYNPRYNPVVITINSKSQRLRSIKSRGRLRASAKMTGEIVLEWGEM